MTCDQNGRIFHIHNEYQLTINGQTKIVEQNIDDEFKLGSPSEYTLQKGFHGDSFSDAALHGKDGASITEEKVRALDGTTGPIGLTPEAQIEQLPLEVVWLRRASKLCPDVPLEKFLKHEPTKG